MKPLYLQSGRRWNVFLDESALRVVTDDRATVRYPLVRLSRVICNADAQWETRALLECLKRGIPVTFREPNGTPLAWCYGPRRRETTLTSLLRSALDSDDWDERFRQWKIHETRGRALRAMSVLGLRCLTRAEAGMEATLHNAHHRRFGAGTAAHIQSLESAAGPWVAERLHRMIADPCLIAWARPGLELTAEFTKLLRWRLHVELHHCSAKNFGEPTLSLFAARLLEAQGSALEAEFGSILGGFERWLRDWTE